MAALERFDTILDPNNVGIDSISWTRQHMYQFQLSSQATIIRVIHALVMEVVYRVPNQGPVQGPHFIKGRPQAD